MAKPIFIIGKERSGTKWLSNTIANHDGIACIQREGAGGILETNVFSHMPKMFGDLSIKENYLGFVTCFSETNFFKLTELDKSALYSTRIANYFTFFKYIMDLYAEKEGKSFWLQKAGLKFLPQLWMAFPGALFIVIQRNIIDNIRSSCGLALRSGRKRGSIISRTYSYVVDDKIAKRFYTLNNVMGITYEELRSNKEMTVRKICNFLGLSFHEEMLQDKYKKNTSFTGQVDRDKVLKWSDVFTIKLLSKLFGIVPAPLLKSISRLKYHRSLQRKFMPKTFDLVNDQYKHT